MIFGLTEQKPRHYLEMARVAWENKDALPFAWRILRDGVCDGCALGTSGLSDWTIPGTHLCMVRLELMRLNTAPALDPAILTDVSSLAARSSADLRALGRLPVPLLRRRGEAGFLAATWDEALDRIAEELRGTDPARVAFYLTSRGMTNEAYYAAQKAARFLGSPHVDNAARLCHAASTVAMRATLGHGAATCSYTDWLDADLIVLFGSNAANSQPVAMKYLHVAKERGAHIAVVNPYREPGLARYWVPSIARSALFGTPLADSWFNVHTGGDLAFLVGVLRALVEAGGVDEQFVRLHTTGFAEARAQALASDWDILERLSGVGRDRMRAFAQLLVERPNAVFIWSMGLTQHAHGVETIRALINVGLARGLPGRPKRGLVPIRGHSGVQGGAEVGCSPSVDASTAARWSRVWEFPVSVARGWTAPEMVDRAAAGDVDVFWMVGGNFLETLPDTDRSRRALARPGLRIHHDIVLSSAMLAESDGDVLILPATTRYESEGGGTETSTERRIIFSPEIPGRRVGVARPEWWVFGEAMARVRPNRANYIRFDSAASIRAEIARAVPLYAGIETLSAKGDQVQWGGPVLYTDGRFGTDDGRAHFSTIAAALIDSPGPNQPPLAAASFGGPPKPEPKAEGPGLHGVEPQSPKGPGLHSPEVVGRVLSDPPAGSELFRLSTRRGKQFNSMVQREVDPLTGAQRDDVLMAEVDAARLGLGDGDRVRLTSTSGTFDGHLRISSIRPGNLEVHWPEGNILLSSLLLDPESMEPDYNTLVTLVRPPSS